MFRYCCLLAALSWCGAAPAFAATPNLTVGVPYIDATGYYTVSVTNDTDKTAVLLAVWEPGWSFVPWWKGTLGPHETVPAVSSWDPRTVETGKPMQVAVIYADGTSAGDATQVARLWRIRAAEVAEYRALHDLSAPWRGAPDFVSRLQAAAHDRQIAAVQSDADIGTNLADSEVYGWAVNHASAGHLQEVLERGLKLPTRRVK